MNQTIWLKIDHSAETNVCVWRYARLVVHARNDADDDDDDDDLGQEDGMSGYE